MKKFLSILSLSAIVAAAGLLSTTSYDHHSNSVESAVIYTPMSHDGHPTKI